MADESRRNTSRKKRHSTFARVVAGFAAAVERFRRGRLHESEIDFNQETLLWDDDEDGGLAASRVPRRPPDRSGSGSAVLAEPPDSRGSAAR